MALALALVAIVLAGVAGWTVVGGAPPGPREVLEGFAAAVSRGDDAAAGALTDSPSTAQLTLAATRDGLGRDAQVTAAVVAVAEDEGGTAFRMALRWALGGNRTWDYETGGRLVRDAGQWRVGWEPSLLHGSLNGGPDAERLELRGLSPRPARVVDPSGATLMKEQTVTAVLVARSAPEDRLRAVVDALDPIDVGVTLPELREAATGGSGEPHLVVTLREEPFARVEQDLTRIPGVILRPQRRLLTVDGLRSPVLVATLADGAGSAARGWYVARVDAQGRLLEELTGAPAGEPADIVVTLDLDRQVAAQRAVDAVAGPAMLVAVRPSDGAILAVAQNRAADRDGPVALTGLYPPGSTFKTVTAVAALTSGAATIDTVLRCPGTENVEGRQIPNDGGFDLGPVPLHTAFARSCNTTFARLGVALGPDALTDTAHDLGLGASWTTPGLTTVTGGVPAAPSPAERVEASIGQGRVVASPFGMALVAAALSTGRVPAPMLIADRPATLDEGRAPAGVPEPVRADLDRMMRETVTGGSATALADIGGLGGKTGTAQFGDGTRSHGWFIGTREDLALCALTVDSGTSIPAVDLAGRFLRG